MMMVTIFCDVYVVALIWMSLFLTESPSKASLMPFSELSILVGTEL